MKILETVSVTKIYENDEDENLSVTAVDCINLAIEKMI